jgi:NAD(P)-dependent dehydrogenase (short-subunit alcohol dehydrogenase family)
MDSNAPARGRFGAFNRSKPIADVHVAIVTGAGSGIGRAVCTVLSDHGFHLTVVGRTESRLTETIGLLGLREGTDAISVVADVGQPTQARVIIDQITRLSCRFDRSSRPMSNCSVASSQRTRLGRHTSLRKPGPCLYHSAMGAS